MHRSIRTLIAAGTLACGAAAATPALAQLVPYAPSGTGAVLFFDYFFADNLGQPRNDLRSFIQWNVTEGSVDLVGGNVPGVLGAPPNNDAGRFVDLGGSTGNPGFFETRLAYDLLPGATYSLSFGYRSTLPGQSNTATASFGGRSFTVSSDSEAFELFERQFTVDTLLSSRIAFQGLESDTDNSGLGIDGVLLRLVALPGGVTPTDPGLPLPSAAVPEPSTWAMLFVGIGLIGSALRRRTRRTPLAA